MPFQNPIWMCQPVLLSKILAQSFITVVNWLSQLCLFLNACCLSDRSLYPSRWAMIFERTMCSSNLQGTQVRETGRQLHASDLSLFLKRGQIFARDHSFGISPVSIDCWKRWANTGPTCNSVASSFRTLVWSSSGPKAWKGFKPLRSLIIASLETTISSMKGADLYRSGAWVFLLNKSVNWPLNSSAFSGSDCHSSFSEVEYLGCLFFWLLVHR